VIEKSYDIVIVGGGSAGVSAAIGASKKGRSVLVVEKSNQLGGQATNVEVGTICGLYLNDDDESFTCNVSKFAQDFATEIQEKSQSFPLKNSSGFKFLPYSIEVFKEHCLELLKEHGINCFLESELVQVSTEKDEIKSIQVKRKGELMKINVKSMVDSSGVSCVSELLGEKSIEVSFEQTLTQIFTLSNCNFSSEQNLTLVLMMKLRKENPFNLSVVPGSFSKNKVSFKLNFKERVSKKEILASIQSTFLFLKENVDGFKDSVLFSVAQEIGKRIGKRPVGKYVLTENDVLMCRKFDDSVANGNWPIEQWDAEEGLIVKELKGNDFYQIPQRCLESKTYRNLFFAGRNISATDDAIASARVIGTCLQTGFASGEMANKCLVE